MMNRESAKATLDWATSMAEEAVGTRYEDVCETLVLALKTIAAEPQVVRTETEFLELGPQTLVADCNFQVDRVMDWYRPDGEIDRFALSFLPAVVVASHDDIEAVIEAVSNNGAS